MPNPSQNIDANEINKFNHNAHAWWDKNGNYKTLHDINPLRMAFIQSQVDLKHKNILDIGCGGGILTESLADAGATSVTGIDMAKDALQVAKLHALEQDLNINYKQSCAETYAKAHPNTFDIVTCMELLEHVPDPKSVIDACAKTLKPGGMCFFSTLNRTPKAYLFAVIGAEYLLRLLPKGTHDYKKFIKPSELCDACRTTDLMPLKMTGLDYHPLWKTYTLTENNVGVNYLVACQKLDG